MMEAISEPLALNNAMFFRNVVYKKILISYQSLLTRVDSKLNTNHSKFSQLLVSAIETGHKLSPAVFVYHELLLFAMKSGVIEKVLAVLNSLEKLEKIYLEDSNPEITTCIEIPWIQDTFNILQNATAKDLFEGYTSVTAVHEEEIDTVNGYINESISIIKKAYPRMFHELMVYVTHIISFKGSNLTGATSLNFYGAILLNSQEIDYSPLVYYVDHIVHEASHLHLHSILLTDQLLLNSPDERYDAPLRTDKRPMLGLFHALFVLSRVTKAYKLCIQSGVHKDFSKRLPKVEESYLMTLSTVKKNAKFTKAGKEIFDNLQIEASNE